MVTGHWNALPWQVSGSFIPRSTLKATAVININSPTTSGGDDKDYVKGWEQIFCSHSISIPPSPPWLENFLETAGHLWHTMQHRSLVLRVLALSTITCSCSISCRAWNLPALSASYVIGTCTWNLILFYFLLHFVLLTQMSGICSQLLSSFSRVKNEKIMSIPILVSESFGGLTLNLDGSGKISPVPASLLGSGSEFH